MSVMNRITTQRDALFHFLEHELGDRLQAVSFDPQMSRPTPGTVAIFVEPPDVSYDKGFNMPPTVRWTLECMSGTPATQARALDDILDVIEQLAQAGLNLDTCTPVSFTLPNSGGTLAAYQIKLNPLEYTME
ncbi:hypothetical protein PG2072B_1514 [Bifidobacterium pseudolongum subsp. globosum]|uniref:Uncharacterized protein n=1 Tax=Bifidobacterium pseudolongum subsp. globosum TaxID=1690 RepID=A0A4Q5BBQ3_9BIFI|nr:hypothetical protein [Bifidobacterium pseudolongum]RYQ66076.1 hypothetical protein PG2072B_1514 [Bifidobacterium pseudolongum subsp. globosum]